jgi:NMD protein affecting ribosome stability and mRNA decay
MNAIHAHEPPRRFCSECGTLLTEQEGSMCSICWRRLSQDEPRA